MIAHASQIASCRNHDSIAGKCERNCPPQTPNAKPKRPKIVTAVTFAFPVRNPKPMMRATGIVTAMVNTPHGLFASACTTTSASTARRMIMIASTLMSASTPAPPPISSFTIWPRVLPPRRTDAKSTIISCTAPPSVAPIKIQSVPGKKPNCAARTGPTRGPGPAMAAK